MFLDVPLLFFQKPGYDLVKSLWLGKLVDDGGHHQLFKLILPYHGLLASVVILTAKALVVALLGSGLGCAALRADGLATIAAFELMTEQVDHFHTSLAILVGVNFASHPVENLPGHDLRIHILKHLVPMTVDAGILLVLQNVIDGISCERLATIQDPSRGQIGDISLIENSSILSCFLIC